MKTLALFISTSPFLFFSLIDVAFAQGFSKSCTNFQLYGSTLNCACNNGNGMVNSQLDLNLCITNNNGHLEPAAKLVYTNIALNAAVIRYTLNDIPIHSGQYSGTCFDCSIGTDIDGTSLYCNCYDTTGSYAYSNCFLGWFLSILDFPHSKLVIRYVTKFPTDNFIANNQGQLQCNMS